MNSMTEWELIPLWNNSSLTTLRQLRMEQIHSQLTLNAIEILLTTMMNIVEDLVTMVWNTLN